MLGKKHARRATSEAERTSVLVHVLLTRPSAHVRGGTERPHEEGDMQNEALLENVRVYGIRRLSVYSIFIVPAS